jgi:hypothetical protein
MSDEVKAAPLRPQWLRVAIERLFVDTIPGQYSGMHKVLREFLRGGQNEWSGCGTMPAWAKLKGDVLESYRVT